MSFILTSLKHYPSFKSVLTASLSGTLSFFIRSFQNLFSIDFFFIKKHSISVSTVYSVNTNLAILPSEWQPASLCHSGSKASSTLAVSFQKPEFLEVLFGLPFHVFSPWAHEYIIPETWAVNIIKWAVQLWRRCCLLVEWGWLRLSCDFTTDITLWIIRVECQPELFRFPSVEIWAAQHTGLLFLWKLLIIDPCLPLSFALHLFFLPSLDNS